MRQYYAQQVTELSEQQLESVFEKVEPPVCLLGGWAVHLHVNPGFQSEQGREYIGSRDIDIGVHIDPEWDREELEDKAVSDSIAAIEELGYTKSRFGFVQNFLRETQERISEEEAQQYDMHEIFQVYIDVIPDTAELDTFREEFGFKPPAEPLLTPVFEENKAEPLSDYVSWKPSSDKLIVAPELLAAMKIRSLPDRDKSHKQVKDAADLHALLWYVKDYQEMKDDVKEIVTDKDLETLENTVDQKLCEEAAQLLQINAETITNSIQRLHW